MDKRHRDEFFYLSCVPSELADDRHVERENELWESIRVDDREEAFRLWAQAAKSRRRRADGVGQTRLGPAPSQYLQTEQ